MAHSLTQRQECFAKTGQPTPVLEATVTSNPPLSPCRKYLEKMPLHNPPEYRCKGVYSCPFIDMPVLPGDQTYCRRCDFSPDDKSLFTVWR